jgi:hypothetical protein
LFVEGRLGAEEEGKMGVPSSAKKNVEEGDDGKKARDYCAWRTTPCYSMGDMGIRTTISNACSGARANTHGALFLPCFAAGTNIYFHAALAIGVMNG